MNLPKLCIKKTPLKNLKTNLTIREIINYVLKIKVFEEDIISKSLITITEVHMSKDSKQILVMFTIQEKMKPKIKEIEKSLQKISKKIRFIIFKKINLKFSPTLKFKYDFSIEKSNKINSLINKINLKKV